MVKYSVPSRILDVGVASLRSASVTAAAATAICAVAAAAVVVVVIVAVLTFLLDSPPHSSPAVPSEAAHLHDLRLHQPVVPARAGLGKRLRLLPELGGCRAGGGAGRAGPRLEVDRAAAEAAGGGGGGGRRRGGG